MKFVSLDPGESTGWAAWDSLTLGAPPTDAGTAPLADVIYALAEAADLTEFQGPELRGLDSNLVVAFSGWQLLVIEDWALYPWELEHLAWDKCRTARGIGALEFIATASGRDYVLQPAKIKDGAEAAGAADFFARPLHENRHRNDAVRHGVWYKVASNPANAPQRAAV